MNIPRTLRSSFALLLAAHLSGGAAEAGNYPLELGNIRPDLPANNRLSRAYPGLEYNIRAAVVGGDYPYTFSLANAPAGMTIDVRRGEITWLNPQTNASPTITVVDAKGATVSATWTIAVSAQGFRFIDAVKGVNAAGNGCTQKCGTGTMENPWRTVSDMYHNGKPGEFVYFRNGTYQLTDLPRVRPGTPWERVEFGEQRRPVVWMAHPGERPVLDFAYKAGVEVGPLARLAGNNVYVDGLETMNSHYIAFQFASIQGSGATFRRLRMHSHGPGADGTNAALIMTMTNATPSDYSVIQDCEFWGVTGESVTIKIYAQRKLLIEDTVHHDATVGIELKHDVRQFTVRNNTFYRIERTGIGGNMDEAQTGGEILFNNSRTGLALDLNQNGVATKIYVYRNTLVGRVQVRNTDSADGPFYLSHNVIVSSDGGTPNGSRIHHYEVTAPNRIVLSENLTGKPGDGIVDAEGNLTKKYARYLGTHGHQLSRPGATAAGTPQK